ncbi:universal stress protein [Jiella avicenniae]|uniref:Universal stress protein n=1 Tax=Jiella avicenniae TaxID=2907202 RepID=A0A9X1P387_9HYPH|nr:universal stress protein [Jiella avicenniae]MCE7030600.1 universal stress protein [Jiella avicenniae]
MRFKTILGVIGVDHSDADVSLAQSLCEDERVHLSILLAAISPPPPVGEAAVGADYWLEEQRDQMRRLSERMESFEARFARADLSADIDTAHHEHAMIAQAVARRARYADLVLVGPELAADGYLAEVVLDGALFGSGRPLLILPKGASPTLRPKTAVVAWSSTPESARAVYEAAEILGAADDVRIVMVDPQATTSEAGPEPGAEVAAYLARHGAKVTVDRLPSGGRPVADVIRQHAGDVSAEMIVMGAYGHSRWRERIFGGVTRSMIENPPIPLLLAR